MNVRITTLGLLAALATSACAGDDLVAPPGPGDRLTPAVAATTEDGPAELRGAARLTFLSRNLYIGTDLDVVVQALASPSPTDNLPALLDAIGDLQVTAWPARVNAIADEIARERPHAVGLQEVWKVDINLVPLGLNVDIHLDFLTSLTAALAERGLTYNVAVVGPAVSASPMPGIAVLDRDVILIDPTRVSVDAGSAVATLFAANIGVVAAGVNVRRGWVSVNATIEGESLRLVNTHLESGRSAAVTGLRALQAGQLMRTLIGVERVVLLGDFNDVPGSPMYQVVTNAQLTDVWGEMRPGVEGFTCCHTEVLSNTHAQDAFSRRIDYVFARGLEHSNGKLLGQVRLLGVQPGDRLEGPQFMIWPSDHAGVSANLLLPANDR